MSKTAIIFASARLLVYQSSCAPFFHYVGFSTACAFVSF